ncbi:HNH endonuclease [Vannielia litorea]|uniref:HNH endonuclease n=1 Tax=Vannielia litorea TaxID=1217970 RepID=UPI001C95546D|nr:HNH endonuclease signature motif containing protein [Vannielia litorea]MBY6153381.1 HNH endonuclease [Vannielia litorea]
MSDPDSISLGHVASAALELLRKHPEGLSMAEMRDMLDMGADSQEHFNRRVRDIRKVYEMPLRRRESDGASIYVLGNPKPQADSGQVSERLRAAVIHLAHGRCQMCGRTVAGDGVKLQADHKVPQSWGGPTTMENLWAICEACNRGKRNYFSSFSADEMKQVVHFESVHERIANFLRLHMPEPVPAWAIEFVANVRDQQLDWRKRLRELRYAPIGLEIEVSKKRDDKGVQSFYTLKNWRDLPPDHVRLIKDFERRKDR